jgi:hypothetical protein
VENAGRMWKMRANKEECRESGKKNEVKCEKIWKIRKIVDNVGKNAEPCGRKKGENAGIRGKCGKCGQ